MARRCVTADEVAAWVIATAAKGPHGQNGLHGQSMRSIPSMKSIYAALSANAVLVLIGVATTLLDRQVAAQAAAFENEGGFTERLYRTRQTRRRGS